MNKNKEYIRKATFVHGNLYSYEKINYENSNSKIIITCKIHGDFEQRATNHLQGRGCRKCGGNEKYTTESFIKLANQIHDNKYVYDKSIYTRSWEHITITCKIHGDFLQQPASHLTGVGCKRCSDDMKRTSLDEFIFKSNQLHNNFYDYTKVDYIDSITKIEIICPIHGSFEQTPHSHTLGHGCSSCSGRGFSLDGFGTFYVQELSVDDKIIGYKYGISKNVQKRIKVQEYKSLCKHKLIFSFYSTSIDIFKMEQYIKNNLKNFETLSKDILPDGYTESIDGYENIILIENKIIEYLNL